MKLTIEFESEWYKVEDRWHKALCKWFGHPRFEERKKATGIFAYSLMYWGQEDPRPRCVRCHAPDPSLPKPEVPTMKFTFVDD